ncbi:MAG TPA: exopolysaccharide biosynthesis protein [Desulfosporosinus sp.]|nr:exopolysaccharide biosynthesis protein [Desulfosporosinus sp.]
MKINFKLRKILLFLGFNLIFLAISAPFIVLWGPFQTLKAVTVSMVYTSRHPQFLKPFLTQAEIDQIMSSISQDVNLKQVITRNTLTSDSSPGITIQDIKGQSFKGKVMLIKDPKRVKLAVTKQIGVTGERVSDLVKDKGAVAGINAGGFYDPNGKGNGAFPDGLTVQDGKLVHNNVGNTAQNIVGFNDQDKLVLGSMTANQLISKHIRDAVTFGPNLIENGKTVLIGNGGWGIGPQPRTGIGQMADGTVIFVVIDGRQPTWSMGATIQDLMNVFTDYKAVTAVNLDGGSSTDLVFNGKVINRLCDIFGERYIPTAFVVTP